MKLFSSAEIRRLEELAGEEGVSLESLMEQAGTAVAVEAEKLLHPLEGKRVAILCGKGNNGGDGFVCARLLWEKGACVRVLLLQGPPQTGLAHQAFLHMPEAVETVCAGHEPELAERMLEEADLIVDAVYGFGFHGELSGEPARFLALANAQNCLKLACDLPSGAECDTGRVSPGAFRADITVTFTGKKPACASYPAKEYCGETVVAQVGIPARLLQEAEASCKRFEIEAEFSAQVLPSPGVQSNKGDLGRLLLVCGSYGMAGACLMAARAALRCGVGLLHLAVEERIYPIAAQAVPEAVFTILPWRSDERACEGLLREALSKATACLLGCGLGELSEQACPPVFRHFRIPLVLDADGLNFLSRHPEWRRECQAPLVLTPHPGEMARLLGKGVREIQADRLAAAGEAAEKFQAVSVLKGAGTVITSPDGRTAVNPTGNPGMAKGGSGDVLAGMVASFAAQGMPLFESAVAGVSLHGRAGDLCAERFSPRAMLPTDLLEALPELFRGD